MALPDALKGLAAAVHDALNAAGVQQKGQVGVGYPSATELVEILANADQEWQISVYPMPGTVPDPYAVDAIAETQATPSLTVAVAGNVVTLGGTVSSGLPVHIGLNAGQADVVYTTVDGDTLASVALALRTLVNGAGLAGVTASVPGPAITVAGVSSLSATVAAKGTITLEVGGVIAHLRVTIWAPNPAMRDTLTRAIVGSVGTTDSVGVTLADGSTMSCEYLTESWSDQSSPDYSTYVEHIVFACRYSQTRTLDATAIAAGIATSPGAGGTITRYTSGGSA